MSGSRTRVLGIGIALVLVASACAWAQTGGNAAHNNSNPFEPDLTTANVDDLAPAWQADGVFGEPVMDSKYVYAAAPDGFLRAYSAGGPAAAEGASHCSGNPAVCTPVWFARTSDALPSTRIAVDGEQVFTIAPSGGVWRLLAFDADPSGCPTTGNGCAPRWTGQWTSSGSQFVEIAVAGGRVYVASLPNNDGFAHPYFVAFDEAGVTNCGGGATPVCTPLFRGEIDAAGGVGPSLAVAGGRVFLSAATDTTVFDAAGQTGCASGVCAPLYRLATQNGLVSVWGTTAYAAGATGLVAFDATGVNGCNGSPRVCQPLWTGHLARTAVGVPPTVSNGRVLVSETGPPDGFPVIEAFDAAGVTKCAGAPVTCAALWDIEAGDAAGLRLTATPSLALVSGNALQAFDLNGGISCAGSPVDCAALFTSTPYGVSGSSAAAVAFGRVAVVDFLDRLHVFARSG